MPDWLVFLLLAVSALWLGRCVLALLEQRRCGGLCILPLVAAVVLFSDLPHMGIRLYDLAPLAIGSINLPQGLAGTLLMAGVIFVFVLASLHGLLRLYERAKRRRREDRAAATAEATATSIGDEGLALEDWQRLLKRADRRLDQSDDDLDMGGAGTD